MRRNGFLLPISSLPSKYGIGSFSKEAYEFVDILEEAGQKIWQILPLGPTGYGDSPYQSFSTFAGNPYFIDLCELIEEGLLSEDECDSYDWGDDVEYIDYEKIYLSRFKILKKAYKRSKINEDKKFIAYCKYNKWWLEDYALYMAIKDYLGGISWLEWDENLKLRDKKTLSKYSKKLNEEITFYKYTQYLFSSQWNKLKVYANKKGISIIGDIPIYVALDSADTWANPELFQLDKDLNPIAVAGCPPDSFSEDGQLWGNPLYDWEYHKYTNYKWWIKRIKYCYNLYDIVRIDHFRGFDEYFSIPYKSKTAVNGTWEKGPGIELFEQLKKELGNVDIIAEDLGFLTESVKKLLKDTDYPGMKILQFAFDSREESDYLPHNYNKNCVVYTGTHDNSTVRGWYKEIDDLDKKMCMDYINSDDSDEENISWNLICIAMRSVADTCVIPVQDFLGLDESARINTPSTLGDNWKWRMTLGCFSQELIDKIKRLTKIYGRI
ncbi:4-alpha-glucanotransferase [Intestinibacter bartlettii]|jgi:4-alpha-glucanotransferase|uniref:4-alpha-glucanotransferase n=1 Tax=Intestinibacter bartlettii CAG:1329 TaxID=1263063 RepID=R5Y057_9FIRM|nr:4-alpha-glucanotransferase [Intestinibacter bartlettii]CDA10072.1 4-alpha-glucanotransferase [Intestinibacter bartlettii CAG:1329]SCJ28456.1 4-alpha-glucanotransferase [uncultured Clostridium sp.]